jgi:ABC-type phosphate transport system substrate-binding protein
MKTILVLAILFLSLMPSLAASGEIAVVANKNNPLAALSKQQIVDIFMGRTKFYSTGQRIVLLDQEIDSSARRVFYQNLVNKTLNEINSYRARLLFSGRFALPKEVSDDEMIKRLEKDSNAIGYIEADKVNDSLKVLGYVE